MATVPITDRAGATVAVVIVNFRTPDLTVQCLEALAPQVVANHTQVVVVDGGSDDGSAEHLAEAIDRRGYGNWAELLALPLNGGFGYANNQAILHLARHGSMPAFVCLLNPDTRVKSGALEHLQHVLEAQPTVGAVGALLEDDDGIPQGSAFSYPSILGEMCRGANTDAVRLLLRQPTIVAQCPQGGPVPWVTGAMVMFRVAALLEVGLFDDGFFLYFEEVELMYRLRVAGWGVWHEPLARTIHEGGASTDVRFGDDGFHKRQALPRFWYDSRRRYFVRTAGRWGAVAAGLAYALGRAIWLLRMGLQGRRDPAPLASTRDTLRLSLWPQASDFVPAQLPRIGDPPGKLPAWMAAAATHAV